MMITSEDNTGRQAGETIEDFEARVKLQNWLRHIDSMDYDAPGSTVRETGV